MKIFNEKICLFLNCLCYLLSLTNANNVVLTQGININIPTWESPRNANGVQFVDIFELNPISHNRIHIVQPNTNETGYTLFQVHCYHFNVTVSLSEKLEFYENGTNLGFVLFKDHVLHLFNFNLNHIQCLFASITYDKFAPIPGGCHIRNSQSINPTISVKLSHDFVIVTSTPSRNSDASITSDHCGNAIDNLNYETFYLYLDQDDFQPNSYFIGIKKMLYGDLAKFAFKSKLFGQSSVRYYSKVIGRGQIFTTVVSDENGNKAYYVPAHTYCCEKGLWEKHCLKIDILKQIYSFAVVLMSTIFIFNVIMPIFIESLLNGAILGATITVLTLHSLEFGLSNFEIILSSIFAALFASVIFGILSCYLKSIANLASKFIVIYIATVLLVELFVSNYVSLPLQLLAAIGLTIIISWINITFSVILGCTLLTLGLSSILRGNLHRPLLNNFQAAIAPPYSINAEISKSSVLDPLIKENYINYNLTLNVVDYVLMAVFMFLTIVATFKKEEYYKSHPEIFELNKNIFSNMNETSNSFNKKNARRRRQRQYGSLKTHNECLRKLSQNGRRHFFYRAASSSGRNPLISHWTSDSEGSDDVFESPASNTRFMSQISFEDHETITRVQRASNV